MTISVQVPMSFRPKPVSTTLILKEVLKTARMDKGMSQEELANQACLKKWHIQEIEETDSCRTFYSQEIKLQGAKRIGSLLGLDHSQFLSVKSLKD